jgi:hypothetical protein
VLRCVEDYLAGIRYPLELISHLLPSAESRVAPLVASG